MKSKEPKKFCHLFYSKEKEEVYGSFLYLCRSRLNREQDYKVGNKLIVTKSLDRPRKKPDEGFKDWAYSGVVVKFICSEKSGYKLPNW